jgi:hypothetical protein
MKRVFVGVVCVGFAVVFGMIIYLRKSHTEPSKLRVPTPVRTTQQQALRKSMEQVQEKQQNSGVAFLLDSKANRDGSQTITIPLSAKEYTAFDAVDLHLIFTNVATASCSAGSAVPLYPRFQTSSQELVLTGVAQIADSHVLFGNTNSALATCTFTKANPKKSSTVSRNNEGTRVYSLGNDITNSAESFTQFKW